MINLITGLPGSGKTLWTLSTVKKYVEAENAKMIEQGKEPRQVYYHGIPELTLDWQLLDNPENWPDLPNGSIVVIDECQSTFRPRGTGVTPPRYISEFETHRHKGFDFYLLTQHPMFVDQNIRRLAGKHYHVIRFYGFQKSTIHEFQSVRQDVDKSQKNSIATHFVYPKEVFNWYKSADLHTMKKRIPMRMYMLIILPLLFIGLIWYFIKTTTNLTPTKAPESTAPTVQATNNTSTAQSQNTQTENPAMTYAQLHIPQNINLPHTAPIYAEITKPVTAPYPAACVVFRNKCTCYSQQGTKLQTGDAYCRQIVNDGYFLDFNPNQTSTPQKSDKTA